MKPQPGLKKEISKESLGELVVRPSSHCSEVYGSNVRPTQEPGTLWIHSVPQEIVNTVSDLEKKRQEAINEVMYTERDFVRDMEYLRDVRFPTPSDLLCFLTFLSLVLSSCGSNLCKNPKSSQLPAARIS